MGTYTFWDLIYNVLKEAKEPLSEKEIWDKAVELGLDKRLNSNGKTPWKTIAARIYVDIRDNKNSKFVKIGKRPTRFYLKKFLNTESNQDVQKKIDKKEQTENRTISNFHERDIHPLLVKFVNEDVHFKAYAKTIRHECSTKNKKGVNEWLHPDIVGVYFPFEDFDNLTREVQKSLSVNTIKLFSFELKIDIDFTNLRQYYFQAVSNSSWANEGYLVALHIKDDAELMNELQRLNSAFGIGIIKLNNEDISQSEIILPAHQRSELDWITIDRLISENRDFNQFFVDITEDLRVDKVKSRYDVVKTDEDMEKYIINKGIIQSDK